VQGDLAVGVVDAPNAVVLLVGPGRVRRRCPQSPGKIRNLSVMPDHQYDLARILSTEQRGSEGGIVIVLEAIVDGQMERFGERSDGLHGTIRVGADVGGEEYLRRRHVVPKCRAKQPWQQSGALEAGGREVNSSVGQLFCVADEKDGGWRLRPCHSGLLGLPCACS